MSMMFRWAGVLGFVGFVSGFIGPMVLAPDANQGPMLGIFITGPGGGVLGAILGLVVGALGVAPATASRLLYAVAAVAAASTLYFCIPAPRYHADVVDGEIRQCIPPERLRGKTVDHLNELAAHRPLPRPVSWGEAFDQALGKDRGVVIEVHVFRDRRLYERQARWSRGTFEVRPWIAADGSRRYFATFAGADCGSYPIGVRSLFSVTGHVAIWPPAYLAEMLALKVAAPLPARDADLFMNWE